MQKILSYGIGLLMVLAGMAFMWVTSTGNVGRAADAAGATTAAAPQGIIRVAAGRDADYKDAQGNIWKADTGFSGGATIDRPDLKVTGTTEPGLYSAEHYSMDSWSCKVPNGTYTVKLHFSEDYDGITSGDDRIFSFEVQGQKFENFSPWKKAGAQFKAYVETVKDVKVTDGQIKITFTPQAENPQINAIEVLPADASAGKLVLRMVAGRDADYKDSKGNVWKAEQGFEGGSTIDRPELKVTGTDEPGIYQSEHYAMESWSCKVPNGTYMVKLHFSEDYDGIGDADGRVFSFDVQGQKFKNFSPWKKAGAQFKAYIETVKDVKVTDGQIKVTFTPNVENPQINAIEVYAVEAP
jgi:hypothetical protein